jgi:hypothetical protein
LPKEVITSFWGETIDFSECKTLDEVVKKVIIEYLNKKGNKQFQSKFKEFIRDTL